MLSTSSFNVSFHKFDDIYDHKQVQIQIHTDPEMSLF
jgi:hypothetical protein